MQPKKPEDKMTEKESTLPFVKQVIRYISRTGGDPQSGHYSVFDVDAYLSEWVEKGYELFNTHYLGENPEGFGVLYVLVKKQ